MLKVSPRELAIFSLCPYRFNVICRDKLFGEKSREQGYYLAQHKSMVRALTEFFSVDNDDRSLEKLSALLRQAWDKTAFIGEARSEQWFGRKALEMLEWVYYNIETGSEAYLQNKYLSLNRENYMLYYYLQRLDREQSFRLYEFRTRRDREEDIIIGTEAGIVSYLLRNLMGIEIRNYSRYNVYTRAISRLDRDQFVPADTVDGVITALETALKNNRFETRESRLCDDCHIQFGCPLILERMSVNKDAIRSLLLSSDLFIKLGRTEEDPDQIKRLLLDYLHEHFKNCAWDLDEQYRITCQPAGDEAVSVPQGWIEMVNEYVISRLNQAVLYNQAITDNLTGLFNRGYFDRTIIEASARQDNGTAEAKLSLILFDIDHFKKINDGYGHRAGDEVLRTVSRIIREYSATYGLVACRYGGEELTVICPLDGSSAWGAAEMIRQMVETAVISADDRQIRITISAGLAEYFPGEGHHAMVEHADAMLYAAKEGGRNQVRAYGYADPA